EELPELKEKQDANKKKKFERGEGCRLPKLQQESNESKMKRSKGLFPKRIYLKTTRSKKTSM
ncbi:hypothetical protein HAX54_026617, partial [Datura stramonium]|nr:hypothetical protein [Datura stramonium]